MKRLKRIFQPAILLRIMLLAPAQVAVQDTKQGVDRVVIPCMKQAASKWSAKPEDFGVQVPDQYYAMDPISRIEEQ